MIKKTELQAWKHKKHDYNATQITGNLRIETNTQKSHAEKYILHSNFKTDF